MTRKCKKCLCEFDESVFYDKKTRAGKVRKMFTCKNCYRLQVKTWRDNNRVATAVINRKARYKSVYKVNADSVPKQGYCTICQRYNVKLVVDHCHTEGHVRGLICYTCNTLLGHVENKSKMERVSMYLEGTLQDEKALKPNVTELIE